MRAAGPHSARVDDVQFREARNAVYVVFFGNGFLFANWAARIPQVRAELGLAPGALGLLLLCLAVGSGIGTLDRGQHTLKGVPGRWRVFAVAP